MARRCRLGVAAAAVGVALLACAVSVAVAQTDILKVRQVNILHRHGARSGQPRSNATQICTESPCGYLSWAGFQMLLNVGAFLRDRYNNDATVVSSPMFESPNYDLDVSYSRSTDVLRTLQSAEALLRGFFPNTSSLYPAIHTMPESTDVLLNSNTQPWLTFFYWNNKPLVRAVCNPRTDELFPDWTLITRIGAEIYLEGYCSVYETRSDCVHKLFDIGAAKKAVGELSKYPLLEANYEKLKNVTEVFFEYAYHYDPSDPLMFKQGGRGQPFVQQLVDNMEGVMAGTNTFKLMHYSAHDTTLGPVWGTLGDRTPDGMMPPFAQTLVAELLQNTTTGAYYVRILRGVPGQSPDTNFAVSWDAAWQMQCTDALGINYKATDNICPYADFKRFTQWSKPADARGYCYLDDVSIGFANCPTETVVAGTPSSVIIPSTCQFYRSACPAFACANGYTLDIVSYQCVCSMGSCLGYSTDATSRPTDGGDAGTEATTTPNGDGVPLRGSNGLSAGAVAGVSIATFCVGALIAVGATAAVCVCMRRHKERRYTRTDSTLAALDPHRREMTPPKKEREDAEAVQAA